MLAPWSGLSRSRIHALQRLCVHGPVSHHAVHRSRCLSWRCACCLCRWWRHLPLDLSKHAVQAAMHLLCHTLCCVPPAAGAGTSCVDHGRALRPARPVIGDSPRQNYDSQGAWCCVVHLRTCCGRLFIQQSSQCACANVHSQRQCGNPTRAVSRMQCATADRASGLSAMHTSQVAADLSAAASGRHNAQGMCRRRPFCS